MTEYRGLDEEDVFVISWRPIVCFIKQNDYLVFPTDSLHVFSIQRRNIQMFVFY